MGYVLHRAFQTRQCVVLTKAWSPKSSEHFPDFTSFAITMTTISHTFQYKIVLQIFKISCHFNISITEAVKLLTLLCGLDLLLIKYKIILLDAPKCSHDKLFFSSKFGEFNLFFYMVYRTPFIYTTTPIQWPLILGGTTYHVVLPSS